MERSRPTDLFLAGSLAVLAGALLFKYTAPSPRVTRTEQRNAPLANAHAPRAIPTRVAFDQGESDRMHFNRLDGAFYLMVRRGNEVRVYVPFPTKLSPLGGYRDLRVGSIFRERDRHYSYEYRLDAITQQGVVISYTGSQGNPFPYSGNVAGQVRLGWRQRPTE